VVSKFLCPTNPLSYAHVTVHAYLFRRMGSQVARPSLIH
jgi:hypothetical protein